MIDTVRLFWRPLREGPGAGEAPPWRVAEHASTDAARDEVTWLARRGRWLARIEAPEGNHAFVVRERVEELPPPWWGAGVSESVPEGPQTPLATDWIDACEGSTDVADVIHAAAHHVDPGMIADALLAACETRRGDIRSANDWRAVKAHTDLVRGAHTSWQSMADRMEQGIAELGAIASRLQWKSFRPHTSKSAIQHAARAETAVRAFAAAFDATFGVRWYASSDAPARLRVVAMRAAECMRYVQNPEKVVRRGDGGGARAPASTPILRASERYEPRAREAARRAILSVLGDRVYLAVADGVNHARPAPVEGP